MPASNNTDSDADYSVGNPPPTATGVETLLMASTAATGVGGLAMLAGCVLWESPPLLYVGFALVAIAVVLDLVALGKTKKAATPQLRAELKRGAVCEASLGIRYPLDAGATSKCPDSWPQGETVRFYERGTGNVLASGTIPAAKCHVKLVESKTAQVSAAGTGASGYEVQFETL